MTIPNDFDATSSALETARSNLHAATLQVIRAKLARDPQTALFAAERDRAADLYADARMRHFVAEATSRGIPAHRIDVPFTRFHGAMSAGDHMLLAALREDYQVRSAVREAAIAGIDRQSVSPLIAQARMALDGIAFDGLRPRVIRMLRATHSEARSAATLLRHTRA